MTSRWAASHFRLSDSHHFYREPSHWQVKRKCQIEVKGNRWDARSAEVIGSELPPKKKRKIKSTSQLFFFPSALSPTSPRTRLKWIETFFFPTSSWRDYIIEGGGGVALVNRCTTSHRSIFIIGAFSPQSFFGPCRSINRWRDQKSSSQVIYYFCPWLWVYVFWGLML